MRIPHFRAVALPLAAGTLVLLTAGLTGCGASIGSPPPASSDAPVGQSLGSLAPAPPEGDVVGQGTVLDRDGDVRLCLGPIAESYPPQCEGIPLDQWTWEGLDGYETSETTRWGAYAVSGTYDGQRFASDGDPILLALYDPIAGEDPTAGASGTTSDSELQEIQDDIAARELDGVLSMYPEGGYLWVDVVWDDGTLQRAADDDFGDGVVLIRSALQPA